MEFEDILKEVGGFGSYQKILIIGFMIPVYTVMSFLDLGLIFMTNTPNHWCYVSEVASSNLSLETQKQLTRPPVDSSCSTYDVNYSRILLSGNVTTNPDWPMRKCSDGWLYDTTDYDATVVTKWDMVCRDSHYVSLVMSMLFAGSTICNPFYGFMSDKVGRKPTFFFLAMLSVLAEITSAFSPYFPLFLILRAIQSSVIPTLYGSGYIILLELVNPDVRSWINGIASTSWTLGLCLLPLIAWLTRNWVVLSITIASLVSTFALYWKLLPESPRWLISEKRYDEAHAILVKISKRNGKTAHEGNQLMQKIEALGEKFKTQKIKEKRHSPLVFFKYSTLRKRFILVTICWISLYTIYYGIQVNVKNLTGSEFINFFIVSVVEIPSHLITWKLLGVIGRRLCLVLGFALSIVACPIPVILPSAEYPLAGIVSSLLAKFGMSSVYMTMHQQSPEMFPTSLRCLGMSLSCSIASVFTLLMPYIVYLGEFGDYLPFLIFGIISLIGGICASFLPETLNKNLPETIADAENFEKNFDFWSCYKNGEVKSNSVEVKSGSTLEALSPVELQLLVKDTVIKDSDKNGQGE